ncbi:stromelysin-3 [Antechinus flavipes]|uniref:stromelysin-3 n=1 Tax=Antechinus flavipes TaxID=38775 RepID=UPI0022365BD2|nr:stromelysin-3 [Antechinus flavipes]
MAPAPARSRCPLRLPGALILLPLLLSYPVLARPAPPPPDSALREDGRQLEAVPEAAASEPEVPRRAPAQGRPRCGVPDLPPGLRLQTRQKRFVLSGGRWEKVHLTYRILRFPWQLLKEQVRQMMAEALGVWSSVTPLTFTEVREGRADIMIDFTRYRHGDNLPFDGPGGILAHAFFPKTHREGDVHFDYDETWTIGNNLGTDLLQVAAHEFGHVLGLQHSTEAKALMSPFYTFRYPLSLSPDDRRGIQHLYGRRLMPRPGPETPPAPGPAGPRSRAPPTPWPGDTDTNEISLEPDACDTDFDAAATIRGELFFFKSGFVWRLREGRLQPGYPALASRHWQGLPAGLDAAFEDPEGNIWFFQGSQYWVYAGEQPLLGPAPLSDLGLASRAVQAALVWGTGRSKIYFFHGGSYWRFRTSTRRVDGPSPRRTTDWRGVPAEISAAFQDSHGYAYFLHGGQYWKFDPVKVRVLEGFPRPIGQDFFGCSGPAPPPSNAFR